MGQEDYLQRQLDLLGRIIGKILTDVLGLKNKGEIIEIDHVVAILKNELDLDLNELLLLDKGEVMHYLVEEKKYANQHIEKLADIFYLLGMDLKKRAHQNHTSYLDLALEIFESLNLSDRTYSIDRMTKIAKIRERIHPD